MAHEILSVKLWELEDRLARLSSRIHLSEAADHPQLQQEIRALRRECAEAELTLEHRLRRSRAEMAPLLADAYGEMARCARRTRDALAEQNARRTDPETAAEEKILLAEYALDFALQAANRALLRSMEAIDAQSTPPAPSLPASSTSPSLPSGASC